MWPAILKMPAGTVKDFRWIVWEIVHRPQGAFEISEAEISATEARGEIANDTDSPSETPLTDLRSPDPPCLARSKPWRPVHQRPRYQRPIDIAARGDQ
jgi:hypothetical protein